MVHATYTMQATHIVRKPPYMQTDPLRMLLGRCKSVPTTHATYPMQTQHGSQLKQHTRYAQQRTGTRSHTNRRSFIVVQHSVLLIVPRMESRLVFFWLATTSLHLANRPPPKSFQGDRSYVPPLPKPDLPPQLTATTLQPTGNCLSAFGNWERGGAGTQGFAWKNGIKILLFCKIASFL